MQPRFLARAKAENAEIHWADETAVMNTDVRGRSYSPRGVTPTTRSVWGTRQGLLKRTAEHMNMVKASPERGKTYFKDKHVAYAAEST